ncbi:MAG: pyruvate kinase alpha/beta domain-containing protein, partial [Candidatus Thorarchaeota archaeon]
LESGASLLTATHAFAGVSRGVRVSLGTYSTTEIIAYAYRTFGQGTKVCAEIAMMAADAGLIPVDRDVVCVGGTGRGADTAWLIRASNTNKFPELKMRGCLCKPLEF